jgi:purine-nucleoside phosphorylase
MNAARSGNKALCICTISDSLVHGTACSAEQRQTSFTNMMEIAFDII